VVIARHAHPVAGARIGRHPGLRVARLLRGVGHHLLRRHDVLRRIHLLLRRHVLLRRVHVLLRAAVVAVGSGAHHVGRVGRRPAIRVALLRLMGHHALLRHRVRRRVHVLALRAAVGSGPHHLAQAAFVRRRQVRRGWKHLAVAGGEATRAPRCDRRAR